MTDRHIVLTGPMGAGKTSVGRILSQRLGRRFVDSDAQVAARFGQSGRLVAEHEGVAVLHMAEWNAFREALESHEPVIVAAAASVADAPGAVDLIKDHRVFAVQFTATAAVLARRRQTGNHRRDLETNDEGDLDEQRYQKLRTVVDLVVDVTSTNVSSVVETILAGL